MSQKILAEKRGLTLLEDPRLNRLTAFTAQEREDLGLEGLLPPGLETLDRQIERVLQQLAVKTNDLEQYIYLMQLLDINETLFYAVLMSDPERFLPIVYDPTVGEACLKFGHIFRRPRGMYITMKHKGRIAEVLRNWPVKDVRFICVSTGGRILGLGDLGSDGMGIPIGKLQLYTACAAVPPECLLPILLDCGTENKDLINDPLYLGLKEPRTSTENLDEIVEEFVQAVQEVFPGCCIHFEDWKGIDAVRLLKKYKDKILCYNDDIQGTGSVALSGLLCALKVKNERIKDQKVMFLGAGSAAIGIANTIVAAMMLDGLTEKEAQARICLFDIDGLIEPSRQDLIPEQRVFAHDGAKPSKDLVQAIESFKPTALIGVSTVGKAFTKPVVEAMSKLNQRPIIFALSNPTQKAECSPEEAYTWSNGMALYAAGVQFEPVKLNGKTFLPGQANNFYIFPAVGLAVYATKAKRITNEMFVIAAQALADQVSDEMRNQGLLYPPQSKMLEVALTVAARVAQRVFDSGLAQVEKPADINAWIKTMLYTPSYK